MQRGFSFVRFSGMLRWLFCFIPVVVFSQPPRVNPRYIKPLWLFNLTYRAQLPAADLTVPYGFCNGLGFDLMYKSKRNYIAGVNAFTIFSRNVKNTGYINFLKDPNGLIFRDDMTPINLNASMRGGEVLFMFGRLFPSFKKHPEWSWHAAGGAGFMQHKYLFRAGGTTQFSTAYLPGYDRLRNGPALCQQVGFHYFSLLRLINFNVSAEVTEAFTKNRRYFDYATRTTDTKNYTDIWATLKLACMLPIKAHTGKESLYFQ